MINRPLCLVIALAYGVGGVVLDSPTLINFWAGLFLLWLLTGDAE